MIRRRGFTLFEALLTLFLVGIILLISGSLVREMSLENRRSKDGDQVVEAHQALDRCAQALHSQVSTLEPISGSSPRLRVRSWNGETNATRLPLPVPLTAAAWTPQDAAWLMETTFEVSSGTLYCRQRRGATTLDIRLLGNLEDFRAERLGPNHYRLSLSWFNSKAKLQSLSLPCWGNQW